MMKRFFFLAVLVMIGSANSAFAADVGLSLSIGQPGFYGQLDIGDFPPPRVIYRQPMIIERVEVERPPVYLRVPPGHAKNWKKHCRKYNACGERVLFVRDDWYNREYVPRYREGHRDHRDDRRDNRRDERQEESRDDDRGPGHHGGRGRGHGHER